MRYTKAIVTAMLLVMVSVSAVFAGPIYTFSDQVSAKDKVLITHDKANMEYAVVQAVTVTRPLTTTFYRLIQVPKGCIISDVKIFSDDLSDGTVDNAFEAGQIVHYGDSTKAALYPGRQFAISQTANYSTGRTALPYGAGFYTVGMPYVCTPTSALFTTPVTSTSDFGIRFRSRQSEGKANGGYIGMIIKYFFPPQ